MRLTLRTMLAYMDEILEPADHQVIGQKIEESEFATDLMHRVRDTTRRLRLGAPKLSGKGMGLDPNTVSEYLDNTLASERVPDFEKVCLESDVHLAEVAACHQVLALVLGEPAEIDPAMRRRMYDVVHRADTPHAAGAGVKIPPPLPPAEEIVPARPVREPLKVPDYLREQRRSRLWTIAATLLLVALIGGAAAIRAVGPFDLSNPVAVFLGFGQPGNGDETEVVLKGNSNDTNKNGTTTPVAPVPAPLENNTTNNNATGIVPPLVPPGGDPVVSTPTVAVPVAVGTAVPLVPPQTVPAPPVPELRNPANVAGTTILSTDGSASPIGPATSIAPEPPEAGVPSPGGTEVATV
ncbi:MAG: hypothetical protein SGJ20_17645, partial [Planctomycetota bacterium]|nr:hypothetical protein [Planctomycetota bacterium]